LLALTRHRDEIVWALNTTGLLVTVAAAFLLYWYPPQFTPAFTETGQSKITFVNPSTPEGVAYAREWARYAWWGPVLLIAGFVAQFVAALFSTPFIRR
jgi:hypothetical protein